MKIAVVGGGISGLSAGVILGQKHEIHLFEASPRLGGHAYTVEMKEEARTIPMDVGFLVFNELNYPHLTAFFHFLGVKTVDSDMSLSVRTKEHNLEWGGTNLNSIFGQRKNLLRPLFYKMLLEIMRFHREAQKNLAIARRHGWTLADLLRERSYSTNFGENYLLPIGAAIWSTPERGMLEYPADTFLTFFLNHKLLQVNDRPQWKTVEGGSVKYVEKARALIPVIHADSEVLSVERVAGGVLVKTKEGSTLFDRVVMATHAPTTLQLLQNPSEEERNILSAIGVEKNRAVLHKDAAAMPRTHRCWSAWNVVSGGAEQVSLTYHLNRLQPLKTAQEYFLSLNPTEEAKDQLETFHYNHPRFTRDAIRAQRQLPNIQGQGGVYFAGAWTRYGFHEDGILSAVKVAELMGIKPPWKPS